jgi:integrase
MTKTHEPENERIKREYLAYLREAKRLSEPTLDAVAAAIHQFEQYTGFRSFRSFRTEQAVAFKRKLSEKISAQSGERLSKATVHRTLAALRGFFHWLAGRPGFRKRLSYSDADYFNLSGKDTRIAKARLEQLVPTTEQIEHVLEVLPNATPIQRRNRALIAFTLLTGARDGAIASFKLKHLDLSRNLLMQDAREVNTKNSKTFPTWFFPVPAGVREIVEDWHRFLTKDLLWGPDDPLFPATRVEVGANLAFEATGLDRRHWTNAGPIRRIFAESFALAQLPKFHPHSFRKTLARIGQTLRLGPEEMKAWSQNLGHESVLTTFTSYGTVTPARQEEILAKLAIPRSDDDRKLEMALKLVDAWGRINGR